MRNSTKARVFAASCLAVLGALTVPGTADAASACAARDAGSPVKVAHLGQWVESVNVDARGRMFGVAMNAGRVFRIDEPGAEPTFLTDDVGATGGVVVRPDGKLLVGTGNGDREMTPKWKVLLVDPDTGAVSTYADGVLGIDGIALAPDGTVYGTHVLSGTVVRITPDGAVDNHWAQIMLSNGIAVSPDGASVYTIQTTIAPGLYRIPVDDPAHPQRLIGADLLDTLALPDGLTLDSQGRPLVATHVAGQIWRGEGNRFCAVQSGMFLSTQVTYGHGPRGFAAGKLYRTGIEGDIYEVPAGFDATGR